ncbi:MAG: hypothetical protein P8080_11395, partial [Gammaproteobacteria bacterium]
LSMVPDPLHRAILEPEGAGIAVLALLLDPRESIRGSQLALLEARLGAHVADRVAQAAGHLHEVPPALRLALLDLSTPALRRLPEARREDLVHLVQRLVEIDAVITPREAAIAAAVEARLLAPYAGKPQPRAALDLLALCARVGHDDQAAAAVAWEHGVETLRKRAFPLPEPVPAFEQVAPSAGAQAARLAMSLAEMGEDHRRALLEALARVASHDGVVGSRELAVLRVAASVMSCPMPPLDAGDER